MMNRVQEGSEEGICSIVPRFRASIESPLFLVLPCRSYLQHV